MDFIKNVDIIDWRKVSKLLKKRSSLHCQRRYVRYLLPKVILRKYNYVENAMILKHYFNYDGDFRNVADKFNSRTSKNIKLHYYCHLEQLPISSNLYNLAFDAETIDAALNFATLVNDFNKH
ncbi:hypothetical protein GVAV_002080 [Gurleya vavrai]